MYAGYGEVAWDAGHAAGRTPSVAAQASRARPVSRPRPSLPSIRLHGVNIQAITEADCVRYILDELDAGRSGVVVTPNLDHLRRCSIDLSFSALVSEAELVVADGMPLVWASKIRGTPLPERVAGSNLISSLTRGAGDRGRSVFLLGGDLGTAESAASVLKDRFPQSKVAGTYYPPFGFEHNPALIAQMLKMLTDANPDIIYVALGSPKQEKLIARLRPALPNAWWLGVGVSFSFLSGQVRRAPVWMQRTGLEWVHRLCQEPRRLFKRYIMTGIPFATALFAGAAVEGIPLRARRLLPIKPASPQTPPVDAITPASVARDSAQTPSQKPSVAIRRRVEDHDPNTEPPEPGRLASLHKLKGLILLGGSVRPTPLGSSIGRSVIDLPLSSRGTILNHWLDHAASVAEAIGIEKLPVRILVDRSSAEPVSGAQRHFGTFRVERDLSEFRGTGGVLRDLSKDYDDDDLILVAPAAQVLLDPLSAILAAMERKRADVTLVGHRDGTPTGLMLVRCRTLAMIAANGFVDMKEQGLPAIAAQYDVRVLQCRRPTGLPLWSLQGYIGALRVFHRQQGGRNRNVDPLAEDFRPSFSLAEDQSTVDPTARIHDSVVLRGGRVESGSVVVRTVVCPGGVVRRDQTAVDQLCRGDRN